MAEFFHWFFYACTIAILKIAFLYRTKCLEFEENVEESLS